MVGFAVDPNAVDAAGESIGDLRDCLRFAADCLNTHVKVVSGGLVLGPYINFVEKVRSELVAEYSPGGGVYRAFDSLSVGLKGVARDYRNIDREQAATYDGRMKKAFGRPNPIPDFPDPDGDSNINPEHYSRAVASPGYKFGIYDEVGEVYTKIEYVVGLDWLSDLLVLVVVEQSPFDEFRNQMSGDWRSLGEALAAMQAVSEFWRLVRADTLIQTERFRPNGESEGWTGNAAEASLRFMNLLAAACSDHADGIDRTMLGVELKVVALNSAMDAILDLVEDLMELVPYGPELDELFEDAKKYFGRTFVRLVGLLGKLVLKLRLAVSLAAEIIGQLVAFSGLAGTDFPSATYQAPDVDGP